MIEEDKHTPLSNVNPQGTDTEMLATLQKETLEFFLKETNLENGLIADNTSYDSPCSIAAVGMALTCYISAVECNLFSRAEAVKRTHTVLKFLYTSKQSTESDATGYKGFYYHFLDMKTGKRTWNCELSTIDTAILVAGILTAQNYYLDDNEIESEIRSLADKIYLRIDWNWALNGSDAINHGWKPESGFLSYSWDKDYSEAHILYILALGSTTFPIQSPIYNKWISTFELKDIYGIKCYYAGPLFIHQMSHIWIDFEGIQDDRNKKDKIDYFENSSRATHIQQQYAIKNPLQFLHYSENGWGFTASNGPGNRTMMIKGVQRTFFSYIARGAPYGPDDGTIAPWAVVASLPFASDIVLKTIRHAIERLDLKKHSKYGFDASFNPTYPEKGPNPNGWISPLQYGLNQGPIIIMIENYRTRLIWNIIKKSNYITVGLIKAGFTGGWIEQLKTKKNESN
ncbi:MAG: glucoamylase family protein [Bacteroidia bacterium]